jgi:hypothetical protein
LFFALSSCDSAVELTGTDGGPLPAIVAGTVSLTTLNGVAESSWTKDLVTNKPAFATQTLVFVGGCSRGTSTVNAYLAGVLKTTATCTVEATFTLTLDAVSDGVHAVELRAVTAGAENVAAALKYDIDTDTAGPGSPVMTQGAQFAASSTNFTIDGTVTLSDGVASVVETNGNTGTLNFSQSTGTFTYSSTLLTAGSSKIFKFVAKDALGNSSGATSITVLLIPASILGAAEIGAAVAITSAKTSTNTLSLVSSASVLSTTQPITAGGTGNRLYGGMGSMAVEGP